MQKSKEYINNLPYHTKVRFYLYFVIFALICSLAAISALILYRPIISINGNSNIKLVLNDKYTDKGATATSFGKDISFKIVSTGIVNTKKVGQYQICYKVKYITGHNKRCRNIEVIDEVKPEIKLNGKNIIYLEQNDKYEELGYSATDNYDGNITKLVKVSNKVDTSKTGKYKIKYKVSDTSKNSTTIERIVIVVKKSDPNLKTIYLTFDDGPSPITYKILDILKKQNVKATFFTIGVSDGYNDALKRIVSDGHTLALHSDTHNYGYIYSSEENYFKDLYKLHDHIKDVTGVDANIIRFPGGSSNTVSSFNPKIMTKLTEEVVKKGFYYFDWNIDSGDTGRIGSDGVYKNVTEALGDYDTYVVLMHDYGSNAQTMEALDRIIKYGKEHGYRFDKITSETKAIHHGVNN